MMARRLRLNSATPGRPPARPWSRSTPPILSTLSGTAAYLRPSNAFTTGTRTPGSDLHPKMRHHDKPRRNKERPQRDRRRRALGCKVRQRGFSGGFTPARPPGVHGAYRGYLEAAAPRKTRDVGLFGGGGARARASGLAGGRWGEHSLPAGLRRGWAVAPDAALCR